MRRDVNHLVQYKLPRHQVLAIRQMARVGHVRPSDVLQSLVEKALSPDARNGAGTALQED